MARRLGPASRSHRIACLPTPLGEGGFAGGLIVTGSVLIWFRESRIYWPVLPAGEYPRSSASTRVVAEHAAERSRSANRAGKIRAELQRHISCRQCGCSSARRASQGLGSPPVCYGVKVAKRADRRLLRGHQDRLTHQGPKPDRRQYVRAARVRAGQHRRSSFRWWARSTRAREPGRS